MIDYVTISASDREAAERFYDTVLPAIGLDKDHSGDYGAEWGDFSLAPASEDKPVTRRLHVGFTAASREQVDEFWRAGTAAGYADDGEPGLRPQYEPDYYGAFVLDPDGNSAEAVHHGKPGRGSIDHVWLRVAGLAESKRFYELVAPQTCFPLEHERPQQATFAGLGSSFTLVEGTPSENVHLAFPAAEDALVDAFHEAAVAAGYGDNGAPGERAVYHPGYYGAFVFDPDGNNVEVVNHNR